MAEPLPPTVPKKKRGRAGDLESLVFSIVEWIALRDGSVDDPEEDEILKTILDKAELMRYARSASGDEDGETKSKPND